MMENSTTVLTEAQAVLRPCAAEGILRTLVGKWKPQVLQLACRGAIRFNALLRTIPGSNKQSLSVAIRELEEDGILSRHVVNEKPLHIEYNLTEKGRAILPIFSAAARVAKTHNATSDTAPSATA